MAMDDLFQSLRMLQQGATELQTSRAINGANQQVQQIKSSEASDADKRQQLTALSNQLVSHLGALGTPVDQIQQQVKAVAPVQYAGGQDMYRQGLLNGDQNLMGQGQQAIKSEEQPKMDLQKLKNDALIPFKGMQFQALQDNRFQTQLQAVDKRVDTQTSRFGNISKLQGVNNRIQDAMSLLEGPITPEKVGELARTFDGVLSQGASTVSGTHEVAPDTAKQWIAKSKEFVNGKPETMNFDDFKNFYRDSFQRIQDINQKLIDGAQRNSIKSVMPSLYKMNPTMTKMYIDTKTGDDSSFDPKTGRISFASELAKQAQYKEALKELQTNPADPRLGGFLDRFGNDSVFKDMIKNDASSRALYNQLQQKRGKSQ